MCENFIIESMEEYCTCCWDVIKLLEIRKHPREKSVTLYKAAIVDTSRTGHGWIYFLINEDDRLPVIITDEAAEEILKDPEKGYTLVCYRFLDRYR